MAFERTIIYKVRDAALRKNQEQMKSFFRESDDGVRRTDTSLKRLGVTMQRIGIGILVSLFAGFAAVLRKGSADAKAFEDAMIGVRKTTGLSGQPLRELESGLIGLSRQLGIGADQLATYAEVAGQLGIRGNAAILAFTKTAAQLAAVSDLSAEDAANAVAKISRVYGIAITEAERVGSVLNELSNTTAATAGEVADALQRIGTAGSSLGFTIDQVAALSATLIDNGIEARVAGTTLKNVFITMSTSAGDLAAQMGVTEQAFRDLIDEDAQGALLQYLATLEKLDSQTRAIKIEEVFGRENFLAVDTLSQSMERLTENTGTASRAFRENTSLAKEFATSLDSFSGQLSLATERLASYGREIGTTLLSSLTSVLRAFNDATAGAGELAAKVGNLVAEETDLDRLLSTMHKWSFLKANPDLGTEAAQKLSDLTAELAERFPQFVTEVDASGQAIDFNTAAIYRNIAAQQALNSVAQRETIRALGDQFEEASSDVLKYSRAVGETEEAIASIEDQMRRGKTTLLLGFEAIASQRGLEAKGAQLQRLGREADETGRELQEARIELDATTRALFSLYETAEGIDTTRFQNDLVAAGTKLDVAYDRAVLLGDAYERMGEAAAAAGLAQQSLVGVDHSDPATDPEDGPRVGPTAAEISARREAALQLARTYEDLRIAAERYDEQRLALSAREREQLQELFAVQDQLRELQRQRADDEAQLSAEQLAIVDRRIAQLERERDFFREQASGLRELRQTAQEYGEAIGGVIELQSSFDHEDGIASEVVQSRLRQVVDETKSYGEALDEISIAHAKGAIDAEEAERRKKEAAEAYRRKLVEVYNALDSLGLITPEIAAKFADAMESVTENTGDAEAETNKLSDTVSSLVSGARGVLRLADAFGDLDDRTKQSLESMIDLGEGIAGVIGSGGTDIGSWVQAIGGLAGTLQGLFGGESPEQREARLELQREIKDNYKALRDNTQALRDQAQRGTEFSLAQLDALGYAINSLTTFSQGDLDDRTFSDLNFQSQLRSQFDSFIRSGADAEYVDRAYDQVLALIESGLSRTEAVQRVLFGPGGFIGTIREMIDTAGEYADTIAGQIERARDQQAFNNLGGEALLDSFLQSILDNLSLSTLRPAARDLVAQILDLNPSDFDTTAEYQAAVQGLVSELYAMGTATGLSIDALGDMLSAILGFAGSVTEATSALGALLQTARDQRAFGSLSGEQILDQFLSGVLDQVGGLSASGRDILAEILGLERTDFASDDAFQRAVNTLISELFALGENSGLSADALRQLLAAIREFAQGVEGVTIGPSGTPEEGPGSGPGGGPSDPIGMPDEGPVVIPALEELPIDLDVLQQAIRDLALALRFGAIDAEEAMTMFLDTVRDLTFGNVETTTRGGAITGDVLGSEVLAPFLDEIEGLNLTTQAGQDRLDEIIAQLFGMGAGAFGLDQDVFLAMLEQLQGLSGQIGVGGTPGDESNTFAVARTITEFQASRIIDVLEAILYAIRGGGVPTPPQPTPPQPPLPQPGPTTPFPKPPVSLAGDGAGFVGDDVVVRVSRGSVDRLADTVYPNVIRRIGDELRRSTRR